MPVPADTGDRKPSLRLKLSLPAATPRPSDHTPSAAATSSHPRHPTPASSSSAGVSILQGPGGTQLRITHPAAPTTPPLTATATVTKPNLRIKPPKPPAPPPATLAAPAAAQSTKKTALRRQLSKPLTERTSRSKLSIEQTEPEYVEPPRPVEHHLVLRLPDGFAYLDELRERVEQGGEVSEFSIRMRDERHGMFTYKGVTLPSKLVDLPTLTETQKTYDEHHFYKVADVSQMMIVTEANEAKPATHWPDGLVKPLKGCRKHRFRKRVNKLDIESIEAEVNRLLMEDDKAVEVRYELQEETRKEDEDEAEEAELASELFQDLKKAMERDMKMAEARGTNESKIAKEKEREGGEDGSSLGGAHGVKTTTTGGDGDEDMDVGADESGRGAPAIVSQALARRDAEMVVTNSQVGQSQVGSSGAVTSDSDSDDREASGSESASSATSGSSGDWSTTSSAVGRMAAALTEEITQLDAELSEKSAQKETMVNPVMRKRLEDMIANTANQIEAKKKQLEELEREKGDSGKQ